MSYFLVWFYVKNAWFSSLTNACFSLPTYKIRPKYVWEENVRILLGITLAVVPTSACISIMSFPSFQDTAGQERFHALGPIYYRDSNGAILVYDITDEDSFIKVCSWWDIYCNAAFHTVWLSSTWLLILQHQAVSCIKFIFRWRIGWRSWGRC